MQFLKKYPLSLLCIALVWYLSVWFLPPDYIELPSINFLDKWTHFLMYGGTCSVIWFEYIRHHQSLNKQKLFLWAWLAPTLMGGLIELVQAYCTTNRSGEWLDFAADAFGCTLAIGFGLLIKKCGSEAKPHPSTSYTDFLGGVRYSSAYHPSPHHR